MSTLFEDVDFEEKVTFPIFFKMKQGGFIRIKENGDIMEMAERHGMLSFMCGNRYTERFKTDNKLIRSFVLRDINAYKAVNKEITDKEFNEYVNTFDERFKKAQNGELTKEFLEELEKFPEEERMGVRPWKKIG